MKFLLQANRHFKFKFILLLSLTAGFVAPLTLHADMYYYKDGNGVLHFSNVKKTKQYQLYKKKHSTRRINAPPGTYDEYIKEAATRHNVPVPLIKAIIKVESDFNPKAESPKGAKGLMQIISDNYELLDINDPYDPWESINGGAKFVRKLLNRYEGNLNLALAAYNAGPVNVDAYGGKVPPFPETMDYVRNVTRYYKAYRSFHRE